MEEGYLNLLQDLKTSKNLKSSRVYLNFLRETPLKICGHVPLFLVLSRLTESQTKQTQANKAKSKPNLVFSEGPNVEKNITKKKKNPPRNVSYIIPLDSLCSLNTYI